MARRSTLRTNQLVARVWLTGALAARRWAGAALAALGAVVALGKAWLFPVLGRVPTLASRHAETWGT